MQAWGYIWTDKLLPSVIFEPVVWLYTVLQESTWPPCHVGKWRLKPKKSKQALWKKTSLMSVGLPHNHLLNDFYFLKHYHICQFPTVGSPSPVGNFFWSWGKKLRGPSNELKCLCIPEQLASVNVPPSLLSCYCVAFGGKRWANADGGALAVNGYQPTLGSSPFVVFCFCPQLITGVKEGMTSTEIWDYLRALWCAKHSLIIRLDNSCLETVEYQARIRPPGFSLTLSVMCHMSQPKAITVIWVSTGSWLAIVKRQACCYQAVTHSCLDTVLGLSQFDGFPLL